jgi:homoserine O-acetyltransferase
MLARIVCIILLVWVVAGQTASSGKAEDVEPKEHELVIKNFHTESGSVLPEARLVYGTIGKLNAARDNAILLPSYFDADINGYATFIGHDKALDPSKFFLVITELFGTGRSSSPSNTPSPFDGPRFPVMAIRDNVNATHQLLTKELHINHLRAVIGFSMGAQQAFQWAVSYPDFMDRIVATAGTAKTYGHGIVRLEGQIAALTTDPVFADGNYKSEPEKGIEATSIVWAGWLYSQEWWRKELWKTIEPPGTIFNQVLAQSRRLIPLSQVARYVV